MSDTYITLAKELVESRLSSRVIKIERFKTGLCHFVYDVLLENNEELVIRISGADVELNGGLYWNRKLQELNIPVPEIIDYGTFKEKLYSIHKKIPGDDIGNIYSGLTKQNKIEIVKQLVAIQTKVSENIRANGYGYALSLDDKNLKSKWSDIVGRSINQAREFINKAGIFDLSYVDRVQQKYREFVSYFETIKPVAFLDDITTKNVIIHEGKLSGIVDTDTICFGDKLWHLGLTKMALLSSKLDTDYIELFIHEYNLSDFEIQVTNFYTACCCIYFMGEIGQKFNKELVTIDYNLVDYYKECFETLI
ncbi:MAG: hypothetical protein JXR48_10050 [Candidatus Delongbacteria bacterium]|nr:hypothetical protein [Candidatus Delongbacteria bacterium]MBN2835296.1 hypothetical protein [Candidatus Delongbacteria bacterium]